MDVSSTSAGDVTVDGELPPRYPFTYVYPNAASVEIEAVPRPGEVFGGWSGALSGTANPTTIDVTCDRLVIAQYLSDTPGVYHRDVSPTQAYEMILNNPELFVVDVREEEEFCDERGHIPNAVNYPWNSGYLQEKYQELPMNADLLIVCKGGVRSNAAADFLGFQDYRRIFDLVGGMDAWAWATETCIPDDTGGFDWGDCSGRGGFQQEILKDALVEVGEIPAGKEGVRIDLVSNHDVDIQLFDKMTGDKIIAWTPGDTSLRYPTTKVYHGLTITYSGYWGVNGQKGREYIEIPGTTNRAFIMKAYGYAAGFATVDYAWVWTLGCKPDPKGEGEFQQHISKNAAVDVGVLPPGLSNVRIELFCNDDVDIQLFDQETGQRIIGWVAGDTSLRHPTTIEYRDMVFEYSGYLGVDGQPGHEVIGIPGATNRSLLMKAFGYASGMATVTYEWGE